MQQPTGVHLAYLQSHTSFSACVQLAGAGSQYPLDFDEHSLAVCLAGLPPAGSRADNWILPSTRQRYFHFSAEVLLKGRVFVCLPALPLPPALQPSSLRCSWVQAVCFWSWRLQLPPPAALAALVRLAAAINFFANLGWLLRTLSARILRNRAAIMSTHGGRLHCLCCTCARLFCHRRGHCSQAFQRSQNWSWPRPCPTR